MEIVCVFIAGVIVGFCLSRIFARVFSIGDIRVDTSEPNEGPYLFLELTKDMRTLMHRKYVVLKVNLKSYISQK